MKVSIVVPAYNEEKTIGRTLESLTEQKVKPYEVIVVNNNSSDNTVGEAEKFKKKLNLRIVTETTQGIGPTKSRGGREAKGDIVAVLDADTLVHPLWIERAIKYFEADPNVAAVTGPWRMTGLPKFRAWLLKKVQKIAMLPIRILFGDWSLNGMNMFMRKTHYDKVGGLDKTLSSHEDFDLAMRMRKVGKLVYADDLWVNTSGRRYKNGFVKGVLEYQLVGIKVFVLGRKKTELEKIR